MRERILYRNIIQKCLAQNTRAEENQKKLTLGNSLAHPLIARRNGGRPVFDHVGEAFLEGGTDSSSVIQIGASTS